MAEGQPPASKETIVLGIEASCDETAAAVVARAPNGQGRILSNVVRSQIDAHREYGGVVPEIAARAHVECIDELVAAALSEASIKLCDVDAVAATTGPGLIGGLIVGSVTGKALAFAAGKPFLSINHLEAHALTAGLTDGILPPYLMLLVSGGHTQLLLVQGIGRYRRLGTTVDDALGEAFDKTAKLLGLGFPGGPAVEREAQLGKPGRFDLPRPMLKRDVAHFSFAGLKTAVRLAAKKLEPLTSQDIADLCADFQLAVTESVADRVQCAMRMAESFWPVRLQQRRLVVAGGVGANKALRAALQQVAGANGYTFHVPPPALCTDNGAMIAWAGAERLASGISDGLEAPVKPRWPLDPDAVPAIGAGVKA